MNKMYQYRSVIIMYHGNKDKSIDNYFIDFLDNNEEHLFYLLRQFIQDMIMEVLM